VDPRITKEERSRRLAHGGGGKKEGSRLAEFRGLCIEGEEADKQMNQ